MTRRFGTIRKRPSGRYQAIHEHEATAGRQICKTFDTKRQAEEWLAEERTTLRRGEWFDPSLGEVRLDEFFEDWIAGRPLAPRTVELYRWLWTNHICPSLGQQRLSQLTPSVVRAWHASLSRASRPGPTTVAKCYRLLSAVTSDAVRDGVILRPPCSIKGAGQEPKRQITLLTVKDIERIAEAVPERFRALVLVSGYGGLRWGEATALRPSDVDLVRSTVTVRRALTEQLNGKLDFGPPKTAAGYRTITLPSSVSEDLDKHMATHSVGDLVFSTVSGLPLRRPNFTAIWKPTVSRIGLSGVRFHDLRHAAATLATSHGATVREVQARLGHASPMAALRYQHVVAGADVILAAKLDVLRITSDEQ